MKKKNTLFNASNMIFFAIALSVLCADILSFPAKASIVGNRALFFVSFLSVFIISLIFNILVHEAGHLVFGLLSGYSFRSYRIFSLIILKADGKVTIKKLKLAGTAGQCLMAPPSCDDPEKFPYILYNLGGSLMNLAVAVLFGVLYVIFRDMPYLSLILLFLALSGVMFALTNAVPHENDSVCNDGANVVAIKRSIAARRAFLLQLKAADEGALGKRLRDMPEEWFDQDDGFDPANHVCCGAAVIRVERLMDVRKFSEAENLAKSLLSKNVHILGLHRTLVKCNLIYLYLLDGRLSEAESLMTDEHKKLMGLLRSSPTIIRTQYVYSLFYEKNAQKCDSLLRDFEKIAKSYPYPVDIESERELLSLARELSEK